MALGRLSSRSRVQGWSSWVHPVRLSTWRCVLQAKSDAIDVHGKGADAALSTQVIALASDALTALGVGRKATLELNSLGDAERSGRLSSVVCKNSFQDADSVVALDSRGRYRIALEAYFSQYRHELSADSINRYDASVGCVDPLDIPHVIMY